MVHFTAYHRPQPRPLAPARQRIDPVYRYTDEEAQANLQEDPTLAALTAADAKRIAETKQYGSSFWLQDGPRGLAYLDPRFPARLSPYSSGGHLANRIQMAGPVGPAPITKFIFALATTHGVLGSLYANFFNILRVCQCCGGHFTPAAYQALLGVDGNSHICLNHPSKAIVPWVASVPYGALLPPCFTAFSPHPAPLHTSHTRPSAPYHEFGSLTALGIALYALNTTLGLPDDVFEAVRIGLVPCAACGIIRTVHAHLAHRPGRVCCDPGSADSSFMALNADEVTAFGPLGDRQIITIADK
ncbi:hypothetical protein B0H14DRAFT_3461739 [Mycena olivaceomarginata]|nr:hypothetical protein B0H14DRAFT_3461739 [Mycena olivaceomarginata]